MGFSSYIYLHEGFPDDTETRQFANILSLRKRLRDRQTALNQNKSRNQYLIFSGVPEDDVKRLNTDSSSTRLFTRLLYGCDENMLIIKVIPSPDHHIVAENLKLCIAQQIVQMGLYDELDAVGSTEIQFGNFTKQPDGCWAPISQSPNPTLVLEIGLSESSKRLAIDARGWLESPGSTVQLAVTADINRNRAEIIFRQWEVMPRRFHMPTRNSPISSSCVQKITTIYSNGSTTATGSFILPFHKIVGRPVNPNKPLEQNFIISPQDLTRLSEKLWRLQGFFP
jgi:hypothetical protein